MRARLISPPPHAARRLLRVFRHRTVIPHVGLFWVIFLVAGCGGPDAAATAEAAQRSAEPRTGLSTAVHVQVAPVTRSALTPQATVSGVVEAFRKTTVAAEVSGRVTVRHVEPGDEVAAGQPMITLDNERARIARNEAQARLRTTNVNLAQARSELRRGENLRQQQFISEDRLETLRFAVQRAVTELAAADSALAAAQRALNDTVIRAPFAGSAEDVRVQMGDFVATGTPVVTVVDFSRARVRAGVTAREAALLTGASTAELGLESAGLEPVSATVHSVSRVADPTTGTYNVEIWLDERTDGLREGMLASVRLPYQNAETALTVPSIAVFRRNGTMHTFRVVDGTAELQPVRTGRANGRSIEVISGLNEGEQVVVEGQFALRDGAPVVVDNQDAG